MIKNLIFSETIKKIWLFIKHGLEEESFKRVV
jgi:hypothetical protein